MKVRLGDIEQANQLVSDRAVGMDGLQQFVNTKPVSCIDRQNLRFADLRVRMLFSCLIDADRLDTQIHGNGCLPETQKLNAPVLLQRLENYIAERANGVNSGTVKMARMNVLNACLDEGKKAPRNTMLFSMTVPTGGGKTLASMAFALQRATTFPDAVRRIIVVIPFLSIIEQNAGEYAKALGDDVVFEHHSGNLRQEKTDTNETYDPVDTSRKLLEENWDAPIVVTTSVRFFESLYSNKPRDLRRLHNLARSLVILDEVQTLPRQFLGTLLSMMEDLSKNWGTQFLYCTATQPAFEKRVNAFETDMRWATGTIHEIIPEPSKLFDVLKRVEVEWPKPDEKRSWEQLVERLADHPRALCVVNLKKHALDLFHALRSEVERRGFDAGAVLHLSTRMCAAHRLDVIARIRQRLTDNQDAPCWVISTQLIEAGVDLDFPVVYRALGPFDSIAQAAGRCDREGKLTATLGRPGGRVVVFRPEADGKLPAGYKEAVDCTNTLLNASANALSIHDPKHMRRYFDKLYGGDEHDVNDIEALRKQLDFPAVADRFKMIDDATQAVLVPWGEKGRAIIESFMRAFEINKTLYKEAQRFQIGLYEWEFKAALKAGAIFEVSHESGVWAAKSSTYSDTEGFSVRNPDAAEFIV